MKRILILISLLAVGCMNELPEAQQFAPAINLYPPVIVPDGMIFQTTQKIVLKANPNNSPETSTGYIVYDLAGANPSCKTSAQYSTPITVSADTLLVARSCYGEKILSAKAQAFFLQLP